MNPLALIVGLALGIVASGGILGVLLGMEPFPIVALALVSLALIPALLFGSRFGRRIWQKFILWRAERWGIMAAEERTAYFGNLQAAAWHAFRRGIPDRRLALATWLAANASYGDVLKRRGIGRVTDRMLAVLPGADLADRYGEGLMTLMRVLVPALMRMSEKDARQLVSNVSALGQEYPAGPVTKVMRVTDPLRGTTMVRDGIAPEYVIAMSK